MGSASTKPSYVDSESSSESDAEDSDSEPNELQNNELSEESLDVEDAPSNRKMESDDARLPNAEEVDRNDPLLIARVRARLNRVKKVKKIGQKTVRKESKSSGVDGLRREKEKEQAGLVNPRMYQLEAFKTAMARNTILYLETGGGKTLVAVLLLKALAKNLRLENDKRIAVFLVPTVLLVQQQAYVIEIHTDLKVGQYYGSKGVDTWSSSEWEAQLSVHEVLVMTPQILLNNLQHGFFKMDMIELLIFDECHHAQKNHAYAQIMKGFYHNNLNNARLPKVFGMTASPVTKKGIKSSSEAAEPLSGLEGLLKSEVFTLKDREEVELVAPTPSTIEEYYDPPDIDIVAPYKLKLEELLKKYENANAHALGNIKIEYKDQEELIDRLRKRINKLHRDLQYCLEELGLWCAYKAAEHWMKGDLGDTDLEMFVDVARSLKSNKDSFLKEAMHILQPSVPEGWANSCTEQALEEAVKEGYVTSKVHQLVIVLSRSRSFKDVKCIIFVERIVAAVVLASLVNHLGCLSNFLQSEWMSGSNAGLVVTREHQQRTMAAFREGKVNLLVATDVAEEGIDVQSCSAVLRFDLSKTVRSFIQSRGRARRRGSTFIVLLERDNVVHKDLLLILKKSEESMREEAVTRTHMQPNATLPPYAPLESYCVDHTGSSVSTETSVNLIARFCGKLPGDKFYTPKPEYVFREEGPKHICTLKLPPTGPITQVIGPPRSTAQQAKQVTALEACKKLHQMGALNDHLVPTLAADLEGEENFMKLKSTSGTGTTQQKELYPVEEALALTGDWHTRTDGALLHCYLISFDVQPTEEKAYANFVLLIATELDEDVANLETTLRLTLAREAKAKLSPVGAVDLSSSQLKDAMLFQEILFNGMFGKLTASIKEARKRKRGSGVLSMLTQRTDLWNSNNVYLLLPASESSNNIIDSIPIDWESIRATSRAIETLEQDEIADLESQPKKRVSIFRPLAELLVHQPQEMESQDDLHLAGGRQVSRSQLVDVAVLTVHTGKIYPVLSVLYDKSAQSEFPKEKDGENLDFKSYVEFFKIKHGQALQYPTQPLLQLKQAHRAHNLLATEAVTPKEPVIAGKKKKRKFSKTSEEGVVKTTCEVATTRAPAEAAAVEMPPELCLVLGFSCALIRSAYLIPSVMSRLKSVVLASQLRRSIRAPRIPVMRVLEALTASRCNEAFNMEALELFGDSFLKYAVSRKLFLRLEMVDEGVLSARRMHRICNKALHQLAVQRGLTGYIRDCQFDPSRWVAPGMSVTRVVECHCKANQMFKAFIPTTSTVVAVSGVQATKDINADVISPRKEPEIRTETIKPRIGLTCDKGHRYLCSKTVADVMEALIGAYLVEGGYGGALSFMVWAGIDVEHDPCLMTAASERSPIDLRHNYGMDLKNLEARIGYTFKNKGLLLEAMTHASNLGGEGVRCYQRLEFLGDAVLDFLLTQHLFYTHPGLTPGLLTKLRSASVNNERYARVAVKHKLHKYLRHGSGLLLNQIEEFVKAFEAAGDDQKNSSFGLDGLQGPKVLGDLVESIAGAILVDTRFDVDVVWAVMKPLLSPIATPDTLMIHPVCELEELCKGKGFHLHRTDDSADGGQTMTIKYEVKIGEEDTIVGTSCKPHKKAAQKDAAQKVLAELETRGYREKLGKEILRWKRKYVVISEAPVMPPRSEASGIHARRKLISDVQCTKDEKSDEGRVFERLTSVKAAMVEPTTKTEVCITASSGSRTESTVSRGDISNGPHKVAVHGSKSGEGAGAPIHDIHGVDDILERKSNGELIDMVKFVDDPVSTVMQTPVNMAVASPKTPDGEEEHSINATLKRKLEYSEEDRNRADKRAKYYWSQEEKVEAIVTATTTNFSETSELRVSALKAEAEKLVKASTSDATDLLNFCPWTGRLTSVSSVAVVEETQSTTETSIVGHKAGEKAQDVPSQTLKPDTTLARGSTLKPCCLPPQQGVQKSRKEAAKAVPVSSRQVLNGLRLKNKWHLAFNLVLEEGKPHERRFMFALTIDTGKEKYESKGEPKTDKKQAQESAATAMLVILRQKGVIES